MFEPRTKLEVVEFLKCVRFGVIFEKNQSATSEDIENFKSIDRFYFDRFYSRDLQKKAKILNLFEGKE